jgi:hypothetical protein
MVGFPPPPTPHQQSCFETGALYNRDGKEPLTLICSYINRLIGCLYPDAQARVPLADLAFFYVRVDATK